MLVLVNKIMMQIKLAQKKLKILFHYNFWRNSDILLINCEVALILTWIKNCALADITVRAAGNNNDPPAVVAPTGLEFQITDTKLYVPVVTLSEENNSKASRTIKDRI